MMEYIRQEMTEGELLLQLAEEATELAHAALKLHRVRSGKNPTPKTQNEAFADLMEEVVDVELVLSVLNYGNIVLKEERGRIQSAKLKRWKQRLEEAKHE